MPCRAQAPGSDASIALCGKPFQEGSWTPRLTSVMNVKLSYITR